MSLLSRPLVVVARKKFKREYIQCSICGKKTTGQLEIDWYPWPIDSDLCATCVRPYITEDPAEAGEKGWMIVAVKCDGNAGRIGVRVEQARKIFPVLEPGRRLTI